ncbi:MAG: resA 6 [Acidobacteria bacterium]|nr:resA 6 [Acidobacteriota bacterium]
MKTLIAVTIALFTTAFMAAPGPAAEADRARFRALYLSGDSETAARDAVSLQPGDDVESRAWIIASKSRAGKAEEATAEARELTARSPENPWSWFALSRALAYDADTKSRAEASVRMLTLAGENPSPFFIAERAEALQAVKGKADAKAFLDQALARRPDDAILLSASAEYVPEEQQVDLYARARKADPGYWPAWTRAGMTLLSQRHRAEAFELLKHAVELAPRALYTRLALWRAIHARPDLTPEQKEQAIREDLDAFARDRGDLPSTFSSIAREYHELKLDDRAREAEERVLREAPGSDAAASVLHTRAMSIRRDRSAEENAKPANVAEYRRLLHVLLDDPTRSTAYHGPAYLALFSTMTHDDSIPANELLHTVEQLEKYEHDSPEWVYVLAPLALADRGIALDYAERLARQAATKMRAAIEADRDFYPDDQYQKALAGADATAHDALGWVLFRKHELPEARKELRVAYEADHTNPDNLYHLGQYYESRGLLAKAEELYTKGTLLPNLIRNDNPAALKAIYKKRHGGSLAGYEAFRKNLDGSSAAKQKKKVLASRSKTPKPVTPFRLATLLGAPMSLDDLKGKVAVINFWGIWCGWCVRELPDLQALIRKYANDPEVRIVTINSDGDIDKVRSWMATKKYDFPVLMDDGWINKTGLHSYPTTWFLDPKGRIAFSKTGWSEKLVDEFTWRIEALKGE